MYSVPHASHASVDGSGASSTNSNDSKKFAYPPINHPPQIGYGYWVDVPPPRGPYFWPCQADGYSLVPPVPVKVRKRNRSHNASPSNHTASPSSRTASPSQQDFQHTHGQTHGQIHGHAHAPTQGTAGVGGDTGRDMQIQGGIDNERAQKVGIGPPSDSDDDYFGLAQPPQIAFGWYVGFPPPNGPYFWSCLPPGYGLVKLGALVSPTTS